LDIFNHDDKNSLWMKLLTIFRHVKEEIHKVYPGLGLKTFFSPLRKIISSPFDPSSVIKIEINIDAIRANPLSKCKNTFFIRVKSFEERCQM
jgi:hypothetical protein